MTTLPDLIVGADGRARCAWSADDPEYRRYHDEEWGVPLADDRALFEKISLEAFQSGLSWITILRRRPGFREAFSDFRPAVVAAMTMSDVDRLMGDTRIIRNRAKIQATIDNARAVLALDVPLTDLVWSFCPVPRTEPLRNRGDVPATTAESLGLSRALKAAGFRFVGPTTGYALMQSAGLVDDHLAGCWRSTA